MTVPLYRRSESQMEYITKAKDLLKFTVSMCSKIPKRYTFYGVIHAYKLSQSILDQVIKANNLNLQQYYGKRTELLDDALGNLSCLSNHLELIKSYITLEDRYWIKWATLISVCEKLIKGVKSKDKERLGI